MSVQPPLYRRNRELLEADLGDELLALDIQGGLCFGFNEVAATVWRLLATPQSFDQLCATLRADYEVTPEDCAADLRVLLNELEEKSLIVAE